MFVKNINYPFKIHIIIRSYAYYLSFVYHLHYLLIIVFIGNFPMQRIR